MLKLPSKREIGNKECNEIHGHIEKNKIDTFKKRMMNILSSSLILVKTIINIFSMKISNPQNDILNIHIKSLIIF